MFEVINFITNHYDELAVLLSCLHGIAAVIVNYTDTPKDNDALAKVYRVVEFVAGIWTAKAKQ